MGQIDVLDYLQESGEWQTSRQIADHFGQSQSVVALAVGKLCKWGLAQVERRAKNKYYYKSTKSINTRSTRGDGDGTA